MSDNLAVTPGTGSTIGMDEVVDGTLGTVKVGFGKIMDGTLDSTNKLIVNSSGEALIKDTTARASLSSIDGKITAVNTGAVVVSSSALPTGAATAAKQPALGTAGSASADVITVQGKAAMTPLLVDGSATTQPVSGTVTANAGTNLNTSALATSSNLTAGTQKTQIVDGSGNVIGATTNALDINIKSGNPTSITANAGTNLNTSALALETGGNLASIKTDVDNLNLAQGSTTSGQKGNLGLGAVTTAAPTYTTGQSSPLSLDTTGALRVTSTGGAAGTQYAELTTTSPATGTVALGRYKSSAPTLTDGQLYAPMLDASGNLKVSGTFSASPASSVVSSANSSTATLTSGSVFTGTSEEVKDYATIVISVIANVASATDGLSVQQSSDGTNWDIIDVYTIPAASGKTFTFQPASRYLRIVYTNGATGQASFRLQTIYHYGVTKTSSQRAADGYTNETDLEQQQAFNMLYNGTTWDRLRGDTTNGLDVDVTRLSSLVAGSAVIGKVGIDQTTPGTTNLVALAANQSTNVAQLAGTTTDTNSGTKSAGTLRVVLATDQPALTNKLLVTPDSVALPANQSVNISQMNGVATTMGNGVAGTGVQRVAIASDNTAFSVNATLAAGTALAGKVGIDQTTPGTTNAVVDTPVTTGGLSIITGSVGATATAIKASAGQLYGYHLFNTTAAVAYVQIFNVASGSVTLGTTAPTLSIGIPASGGVTVNFDKGIAFSTAISFACTTTRTGLTGATCDVNFFYK
jgi:hypothetical protein